MRGAINPNAGRRARVRRFGLSARLSGAAFLFLAELLGADIRDRRLWGPEADGG